MDMATSASGSRRESRRSGTSSSSLPVAAGSSTSFVTTPTHTVPASSSPPWSVACACRRKKIAQPGKPVDSGRSPDSRRQLMTSINDIFKCTICFGALNDPHLCPRCSKMYCYGCIDEWLETGASQCCPNCKLGLRMDQLVKVRWFDDIEKLQRNLDTGGDRVGSTSRQPEDPETEPDLCPRHGNPLSFFCSSCNECVCEACATDVDDGRHRDHTFKTLHVTYEQHLAEMNGELEKVEHYRDKLEALVDKIDRNIELIGRVKEVKMNELEELMEAAMHSLAQQEKDKVTKLKAHRDFIVGEMYFIDNKVSLLRWDMATRSRSQVIQMKPKMVESCNTIRSVPIRDFKHIRVPASLKIELPVIYETGIFVVQNFSTFDDNKVVYSSEFSDCLGRSWRIMAWCVISEDHFGIYLELMKGLPCWMECTFQLIHDDPAKTISKTIREYFDRTPQKGWGLRDFVTLSTIVDDHYLRDNDSLELLYHIRPCHADDMSHASEGDLSLIIDD
ncbi:AGAP001544-PB-like protein [Anopheles sinensis]|uniref:AGAP001544-PB-like protein n=1 Tax=Anopheles sinensis TaxID=74873 RepID=A0A084W242_ANOSI|nr:AGAP001544-PB-like protein [Anopheles sinensis]